jgi:Fe-S cluster assembly protein SufD
MLNTKGTEPYLSAFDNYQKNGGGVGPAWLKQLRESAIASFAKLGFPTTRNEDWKYTSVDPIASTTFERVKESDGEVAADAIAELAFTPASATRLVFIDGIYSPGLSELAGLPRGVRVERLADALTRDDDVLRSQFSRYARHQQQSFVALNTAFVADGAVIVFAKGQVVEEPIYLIFVSTGGAHPVVSHPRNLIFADEGSQARIVQSHVGIADGVYFSNAVTELVGGEGAAIDYYVLQREGKGGYHIGTLEAQVNRQCTLAAHTITLAGSLVRNDLRVVLNGEGSECSLNGLYVLDAKQHVDNHTEIEHCMPHAKSHELYKGILSGHSRGVFNGKILVHKDAQKSDARQTNKNLLLSENAMVNTKPQLEIHADDVKCSHGSTVGQLDRDALFYLRARGIGLRDAQSLLSYAFASEVVGKVQIAPMRARLDDYLLNKFRGSSYQD